MEAVELRALAGALAVGEQLVAIANDGTLWSTEYDGDTWLDWQQLPALPQPGAELAVTSEPCGVCSGQGFVQVRTDHGTAQSVCGVCGGSGRVNPPAAAPEGGPA